MTAEQRKRNSKLVGVPAPERSEEDNSVSASSSVVQRNGNGSEGAMKFAKFWPTVMVIELTDIAFAVDSILAAIALVGAKPETATSAFHPKLWVVVAGVCWSGTDAICCSGSLSEYWERFPRFETSAYLLVTVIGVKLMLDYLFNDYCNSSM